MAQTGKDYILMHKNVPVADFTLGEDSGAILSVGTVYECAHVPVGIPCEKGIMDRRALNLWWRGRSIPESRMGISETLEKLELSNAQILAQKCLGLSLSDQYWIRPRNTALFWEQMNFFENSFSEDMGRILFGKSFEKGEVSLFSPDNTSDGWLKKKWVILKGKRCLIKGGSGAISQEPYNEVIASRIMDRLHISHVSYSLLMEEGYPYSVCENFVTPDTELITAWHIMQMEKKPNHISLYRHYLNCCERLGIPGMEKSLDEMMVLDYLIANEDRHQNNFGAIRRADTLQYLGAAPIFDSGTSLWWDKPAGMIKPDVKLTCKAFKTSHEEQIKLVKDFDWLDFSALSGVEEEICEIVGDSLFIDRTRCKALCEGIRERIKRLEKIALSAAK